MAVTLSVSPLSKEVTVSLATFLFNCADVSDGFLSGSAIQEAPRAFCGPPDPPFELFQTGNETNVWNMYVSVHSSCVSVRMCCFVHARSHAMLGPSDVWDMRGARV